jgi:hypothetical protein
MDIKIIDQRTAQLALRTQRDRLAVALDEADVSMDDLRNLILTVRPSGLLTVDEMAEAIDRERNYVDSVWSNYGATNKDPETGKVRQTRVAVTGSAGSAREAVDVLTAAARRQRNAADAVTTARAERDRVVAVVYASKLLGPTSIADEVQVDRNHVLRIARRAGVAPAHRQNSRNQYSENQS